MSAYKEQLETLAAQSGAIADGGVVEVELDETTQQLKEVSDEADGISRTVCDATALGESLESYVNRFLEVCPESEWNRKTAQQYELGVTAILSGAGVSVEASQYCESFESVGRMFSNAEHLKETLSRTKAFLKRIWEIIKDAMLSFVRTVQGMIQRMKLGITRLDKAGDRMIADGKRLLGQNVVTISVPVRLVNANYLKRGSTDMSADVAINAILNTANLYDTHWNRAYSEALAEATGKLRRSGEIDFSRSVNELSQLRQPLQLPGQKTIKVDIRSGDDVEKLTTAKIEVTHESPKAGWTDAMSPSEMVRAGSAVKAAARYLNDATRAMDSAQRDTDRMLKGVQQIIDSLVKEITLPESNKRVLRCIAPLAMRRSQSYRVTLPMIVELAQSVYTHAARSITTQQNLKKVV